MSEINAKDKTQHKFSKTHFSICDTKMMSNQNNNKLFFFFLIRYQSLHKLMVLNVCLLLRKQYLISC